MTPQRGGHPSSSSSSSSSSYGRDGSTRCQASEDDGVRDLVCTFHDTEGMSLVVIIGTTGVGKSQLAVDLARSCQGEVINADSMQLYRGLDVLTNKVTRDEMQGVPHSLLGFVDPAREYQVGEFCRDAEREIARCSAAGRPPIVAGGTAYYVQSLLFPARRIATHDDLPAKDVLAQLRLNATMRSRLEHLEADQLVLLEALPSLPNTPSSSSLPPDFPYDLIPTPFRSPDALAMAFYDVLVVLDRPMSERWHPRDIRKTRRSLEICLAQGRPGSEVVAEQDEDEASESRWRTLIFWLRADEVTLAERLDRRVDKMVEVRRMLLSRHRCDLVQTGLLEEVKQLRDIGSADQRIDDTTSGIHQAIGYREMLGYLSPPCRCSPPASHPTLKTDGHRLAHAIDRTKISTRQYAKRQTSWIERRLLPPIASAENVHLCVLDATDLTRWSEVSGEAIKVYEVWRDGQDLSSEKAATLAVLGASSSTLSPSANLAQQQFLTCEICTTSTGQPLRLARAQMQIHLKSKGHRHRAAAKAKNGERAAPKRLQAKVAD